MKHLFSQKRILGCCFGLSIFICAQADSGRATQPTEDLPVDAQSKIEPPTMGWSSWNTYSIAISDSIICSQADAMVARGLRDAGYDHINIDDGYFYGRDEAGNLKVHPYKFPKGLKPVVDHIHTLGLKAGIYSDAGPNTCGSLWNADSLGRGSGMYGHDSADADFFFKKCGFDFIKIDYCGGNGENDQLDLPERERYGEIAAAIRATGRPVRINMCRWAFPGTWAPEVAASWRISPDINASWGAVRNIIRRNLYLSAFATGGHYNDMDMLEVGRGLTPDEDATHFGMWCIMASPLLIGCDMNGIDDSTLSLLTNPELIEINQDPLGLQAYVVAADGEGGYALVKDLGTRFGTERVIALYNSSDEPRRIGVALHDVELGGAVKLRDLYTRSDAGIAIDSISALLSPHATRIYRLSGEYRTERPLYEAETGWYNAYQDLDNHIMSGTPSFALDSTCSGGVKIINLGGSPENYIEWRDVWSEKGGEYIAELLCQSSEVRELNLIINGVNTNRLVSPEFEPSSSDIVEQPKPSRALTTALSHAAGAVATTPFTLRARVTLQPGVNEIRLSNPEARMPDIDALRLTRIK